MNRFLLSAAWLAAMSMVVPSAASADDTPLKGDLATFRGTWTAKIGPDKDRPLSAEFEGTAVKFVFTAPNGDKGELKGKIKLDETAKPHKTIDFVDFTDPNGNKRPDREGIYIFKDKDTLRVSTSREGARPTVLTEEDGPDTITFKREPSPEKPKDKEQTAPCEQPKADNAAAPKGDVAKLQGTWTGKLGPEKNVPVTMIVKDQKVTFTFTTPDGQDRELKGEFTLDESAKPEKSIDWVKFMTPNGAEAPANLGIYQFKGKDTLEVCNGGPGNERPKEFKAGEGRFPNLIVLTRKAEEAK